MLFELFVFTLIIIVAVLIYKYFFKKRAVFWSGDIEKLTEFNTDWRKVLHTTDNLQLVAMSVPPGEELGNEVHTDNDQFFRVESGNGSLIALNGSRENITPLQPGIAAIVPRGTWHNVKNEGSTPLKLYTIYGPPHHRSGLIDRTHLDELRREKNN